MKNVSFIFTSNQMNFLANPILYIMHSSGLRDQRLLSLLENSAACLYFQVFQLDYGWEIYFPERSQGC